MGVSLYSVRVVLDVLGTEDYGIYNVVGGMIVLLSFLGSTMASATQRYLSFELGKEDNDRLKKIFSLSLISYFVILCVVVLLAETVGLWFINNKLTIPEDRMFAANCVYQSTVLSFVITLFCLPYNAAIIAMERMSVFAYAGIVDSLLKLAIALTLPFLIWSDSLIIYAVLILLSTSLIQLFYYIYCKRKFSFCTFQYNKDFGLLKEMLSYAGWNMIGSISHALRSQGLNILINMFFCPVVNAARGVAYQVNSAIHSFTNNFYTAVRPQLVKLYSSNQKEKMVNLGYSSSKFAYYLLLFISIPLFCETSSILGIWLKDVPEFTVLFLRITIVASLIEVFSMPLVGMLQAAGKIKLYQSVVSVINLLNVPVSYIFLSQGYGAEYTMYINVSLLLISMIPRLIICKRIININLSKYLKNVILSVLLPTIPLVLWILYYPYEYFEDKHIFLRLLMHVSMAGLFIGLLGLTRNEKRTVVKIIKKRYARNL